MNSQMPSEATMKKTSLFVNVYVDIAGSAITPTCFTHRSPNDLDIANPTCVKLAFKYTRAEKPSFVRGFTKPPAASMRACSSGTSGLWSTVRSLAMIFEPFFVARTALLSPADASVRVLSTRTATTAVVPECLHLTVGSFFMAKSQARKVVLRATGRSVLNEGCLCRLSRMYSIANCETSWPCSPCPSYTANNARRGSSP
mmetsp:Transcript_3007/g.8674  ORF Transcript_3007/g.8674 Transcript_3007/m.8674 type:complete len:200 (-) Transcript_3007:543-1142(-)